ncbi:hypothetical protein BK120_05160 [Paenibacillus sp. FSL A5-0031]|uniref:DUF4179 domain-containing protein n=1 Tax=Paenibacillus sp. FSL A5-0031 TaxID=1920420 RepID=UPI00096D60DF|nr:DUF4179 domain-containing protein [Paenibacillus sp. FSL A5-0031]OME87361.1 hypothetical protein BK120_05160 [Paenibacillus sp. FSL A5-0031]
MSIYKELNDLNLDVSQYEEQELTSFQKKSWDRRVRSKIRKRKTNNRKKYAGVAAAIILAAGISISTGTVTFANVPFVGGLMERLMATNADENADYSPFKTEIGATAENKYGKWTLDEALIDNGRLLISSTFEPAEGVKFNYKMHPMPTVLMNGQNLTSGTAGQSIKVHDSMYTVYNELRISELPIGETIAFQIRYDNLDWSIDSKVKLIENPWSFDIKVPTNQLAATSETIAFNQDISLGNGQSIHLKNMVVSPISTILYYDWTEQSNHIAFKIVSEAGVELLPNTAEISAEGSYNCYVPIDLKAEKYYLVPFESSENPHADNPGEVPEQSIPINP